MCKVGICNEGGSSSTAIGLSNDCKWVFNDASLTPWCHVVVHFEVKMRPVLSRFFRTIVVNVQDHNQHNAFFFHGNFL